MQIISVSKLKEFWATYPNAETSLRSWYKITEKQEWKNPAEVRLSFRTVDFVKNFTVFDIGGNNYRLIAYIDYEYRKIFIRHILTHGEYDQGKWRKDEWLK